MTEKPFSLIKDFYKRMKHQPCIVFLGGYPYPARLEDGLFQRIDSIYKHCSAFLQIYIDRQNLPGTKQWVDRPEPGVLTISIRHNWIARILSILSILYAKRLYIHSVYQLKYLRWLLSLPNVIKVIEFHGIVPEEHLLANDIENLRDLEKYEEAAIKKADYFVFVNEAMAAHFSRKYAKSFHSNYSIIPTLPNLRSTLVQKPPLSD